MVETANSGKWVGRAHSGKFEQHHLDIETDFCPHTPVETAFPEEPHTHTPVETLRCFSRCFNCSVLFSLHQLHFLKKRYHRFAT